MVRTCGAGAVSWRAPGARILSHSVSLTTGISELRTTLNSELAAQRAANGEPRLRLFLDGTAFLYSILSDPALGPCWEWAIGAPP